MPASVVVASRAAGRRRRREAHQHQGRHADQERDEGAVQPGLEQRVRQERQEVLLRVGDQHRRDDERGRDAGEHPGRVGAAPEDAEEEDAGHRHHQVGLHRLQVDPQRAELADDRGPERAQHEDGEDRDPPDAHLPGRVGLGPEAQVEVAGHERRDRVVGRADVAHQRRRDAGHRQPAEPRRHQRLEELRERVVGLRRGRGAGPSRRARAGRAGTASRASGTRRRSRRAGPRRGSSPRRRAARGPGPSTSRSCRGRRRR